MVDSSSENLKPQVMPSDVGMDSPITSLPKKQEIVADVVAFVSGALTLDKNQVIQGLGNIAQAALRGDARTQLGVELKTLFEKGKLKDRLASKYGFQSLVELMQFIDHPETPDSDRLKAVKALFYAINVPGINDDGQAVYYRLFKIGQSLSASQFTLLFISYNLRASRELLNSKDHNASSHDRWLAVVNTKLGQIPKELIEIDEEILMEKSLMTKRQLGDRSGIIPYEGRLTDTGIKLVETVLNNTFDALIK